jgi:hypothetical protein
MPASARAPAGTSGGGKEYDLVIILEDVANPQLGHTGEQERGQVHGCVSTSGRTRARTWVLPQHTPPIRCT